MKKYLLSLLIGGTTLGAGAVIVDNQINPFIESPLEYSITKQSTIEAGGDVRIELNKKRPEARMEKWNGQAGMTVRYLGLASTTPGARPLLSKNVYWGAGKEIMEVVPLDASAEMEDGGMEINILLSEKPLKNTFDFAIEGADNLDFFYQPALTQQEIDEGASRPDNVIGSYAVYHKFLANHQQGLTNYATGKAYHIYRPKVIDANGVEEWADLSIEKRIKQVLSDFDGIPRLVDVEYSVLVVTVPQKFLDDAVYPVKVDPTFGYTSNGASELGYLCLENGISDTTRTIGRAYPAPETGTVTSVSIYVNLAASTENIDIVGAIYQEDSGGAGTHALINLGEILDQAFTTTKTWYSITLSASIISATKYIIAGICNASDIVGTNNKLNMYYDSGGTAKKRYLEASIGSSGYSTRKDEDPWTQTASNDTLQISIYATYTASAGATPQKTIPLLEFN